jgi:VWFA-related protein
MTPRAAVLLLLVAPAVLTWQQPQVFRGGADVVSVDVSVRAGSRPVTGLGSTDFEVLDNGVPQTIEAFSLETLPIDVTLLLDASRSVEGTLLDRLKVSVVETAGLLSARDALRLIALQHRVRLVFPFQPGGTRPPVDNLTAQGGTSLFDGLVATMMRKTEPDRRQLVIAYTDGQDTVSIVDAAAARDVALRADTVVHLVVPLAGARTKPPADTPPLALLRDLAGRTGGALFYIDAADPITEGFRRALDEFRTSYVLRYSPTGVARPGWHEISVKVKTGQYEVRARKGYSGG